MTTHVPVPSTGLPARSGLLRARCLFHPLREAAARCPHCGGTFCRECVTDEDDKLACPPCLRRMARPAAPKPSAARVFRQIVGGAVTLACVVTVLFLVLRWRVSTPELHLNFGGAQRNVAAVPPSADE